MNFLKKIYDWIVCDLIWDLSHSAKWDLVFHLIIIVLQIITLIFILKIYGLIRQS